MERTWAVSLENPTAAIPDSIIIKTAGDPWIPVAVVCRPQGCKRGSPQDQRSVEIAHKIAAIPEMVAVVEKLVRFATPGHRVDLSDLISEAKEALKLALPSAKDAKPIKIKWLRRSSLVHSAWRGEEFVGQIDRSPMNSKVWLASADQGTAVLKSLGGHKGVAAAKKAVEKAANS